MKVGASQWSRKEHGLGAVPKNVAALLAALRFRGARPEALAKLDDAEWRDLLPFCDLANLTLLLHEAGRDRMPDWVRSRIAENLADNAMRFERIGQAYTEIAQAFEAAGIEHVVVKGFSLAPGFVRSPRLRLQSDIDLLCPRESLSYARDALFSLGYEMDLALADLPADHWPPMIRRRGWQWRGNYFDPCMPPSVELHYCLWNEAIMRFPAPGVERFWERRVARQVEGLHFAGLCPADNLGYCALHALRDLLRNDWIVHRIYELARFLHLHAADAGLWTAWSEQHDDTLRSIEVIPISLAVSWFSCDIPEPVQAQLRRLPEPVRRWLGCFAASPLVRMFRPNKDEVWLHLSLLSSPRHRLPILRSALLPGRFPGLSRQGQDETKFRRVRKFRISQRHARYILFALSRSGHHARALLSTCVSGIRWWMAGMA